MFSAVQANEFNMLRGPDRALPISYCIARTECRENEVHGHLDHKPPQLSRDGVLLPLQLFSKRIFTV
jgi:hypothetical protein